MYTWIYLLLAHVVAALEYRVAVESAGAVSEYAHIIPELHGVFEYKPVDSELPSRGCIGLLTDEGFVCHSLYKLPANGVQREAVKCYIGTDGTISQVQLVEGPRSEFIVETAQAVPRPAISAVTPIKKGSKTKLSDKWKNRKQTEEEPSEEREQGFWEKYWLYIVPAALVLLSNAMKPKN